jgi:hypothetical protein
VRLHRFLVPLAAAVVILGIVVALVAVLNKSNQDASLARLIALKGEAEQLAIDGKLPEAHAKYREFFKVANQRVINVPGYWNLMERAQLDQDRVYLLLLARDEVDPTRVLTPPLPTRPATAPASTSTASFVDTYPPYRDLPASPTTLQTAAATRAAAPATARPATNVAIAPTTGAVAPTIAAAPPATTPAAPENPLAAAAELPQPQRFHVVRTPRDPAGFSDQLVGQALALANEFLMAQFKEGEIQQGKELSETYRQGLNALVVYALINSGQATRDPRLAPNGEFVRAAVERMKLHPMATDTSKAQQPVVYARSLRAAVLAAADRPEDRQLLKDDVTWLIDAAVDGAYSYDDRFTVRVAPGDPRGAGRNVVNPQPPPAGINNQTKPKTLGPTRGEQQAPPPAPMPKGNASAPPAPASAVVAQLWPMQALYADGLHDPRTGQELGPPGLRRPYPPVPPPNYPPQELPDKYSGTFIWDNSNTQYGLLGVIAAADVGIEVPDAYWAAAQKHWLACQLATGEWPYRKDVPGGRLAMTCAGLASLMATHDLLEAPTVAKVGRQPSAVTQALANGFAWLEKGDNAIDVMGRRTVYLGYTLHTLARVGLATGYKYLGQHDWYRELSRKIVLSQWANGSWGRSDQPTADTLIDTAYTVLFLARGRHPIVMNKLRLEGDRGEWNNRPRDLAGLTRFASRELERPVNWQVVSIDRDPAEWSDAPILYVASHAALRLSDPDVAKIRAFVEGGGMLFTQADTSAESFTLYVNQLAKRLFPEFEMKDLPADDEVYTLQYVIPKPNRPRLRGISNGARLLWIHSPQDLAVSWQQRAEKTKREAFELGVNLFVYAGGKQDLRNRLEDRAIPAPVAAASSTIPIARLKYAGNWNPEPGAWPRFARYLQWETSVAIDPVTTDLAALKPIGGGNPGIAHLAGTAAFTPSDAELTALREFVTSGGTLIAEGVGGADSTFADALQGSILPKAFPDTRFEALPPTHPMLHATFLGTEDVWAPRLRGYAVQKLGKTVPQIRSATVGKGRVIYLPLDVTSGLLGSNTWPILGYESNEAQALMKNIVLWNTEHAPN